jgi:hypothetical protein
MAGGNPNSSDKISNNFNAAMQFSQLSISSAILLNGAAATAILAFFSGGGASNPPIVLDVLRMALRDFALGAVLGGAACIAAFFTRWLYLLWALGYERVKLGAWVLNSVAIAVTIASFGYFFAGVLRAS